MKNKLGFVVLAMAVLAIGIVAVGCATAPAGPVYPFDGTSWTKSVELELTYSTSEAVITTGGIRVAYGNNPKGTLNADGTLTISEAGNNAWAHYSGTWTKKSGEASGDNRAGSIWTRTEAQTLLFADGSITMRNESNVIIRTATYKATDKKLSFGLRAGSNTTAVSVNYAVDGSTLTVSNASQVLTASTIAGTWTKK
jgi:hypothetical protein